MREASGFRKYDRIDILCCAAVMLLALWIGLCSIDSGIVWGDDWAGYLGEGIAIANGELDEYAEKLIVTHPSELTSSMKDRIIYVWGKPLVDALVYKFVGFDEGKLLCYKIPDLILFIFLSVILYLFFRRRMGRMLSLAMAFMFIGYSELRKSTNQAISDVQYLFFSILAVWLMDLFFAAQTRKHKVIFGAVLGFALFAAYVTRLNGYTLLIVLAIGQAARLCKASDRRTYLKTAWIPYGVFLLLLGVSCLFLPMATSNHSDFAKSTIEAIAKNYEAFDEWMGEWFAAMAFDRMKQAWFLRVLVYLTMFVGMWKRGGIEELHLSVLCVGTLVVTNLLPYAASEGIRYYFTMLPLMLLFLVEGVSVWGGMEQLLAVAKKQVLMAKNGIYFVDLHGLLLRCQTDWPKEKQH